MKKPKPSIILLVLSSLTLLFEYSAMAQNTDLNTSRTSSAWTYVYRLSDEQVRLLYGKRKVYVQVSVSFAKS